MTRNLKIASIIFTTLIICFIDKPKAQIPFFSPAYQSSYQSLYYKELPDSMFIYEVSSTWGPGILFFISYKEDIVKMGYFLSKDYIFRATSGYVYSPKELPKRDSIIYRDTLNIKSGLDTIDFKRIEELSGDIHCNDRTRGSDGLYYSFTMLSRNATWSRTFYDIVAYKGDCLNDPVVKTVNEFRSFFLEKLPDARKIRKSLLDQYKPKGKEDKMERN